MAIRELETAGAVIDVIGSVELQRMTGRSKQCVSNDRALNRFPPNIFDVMQRELRRRRYRAPAHLWGQVEDQRAA